MTRFCGLMLGLAVALAGCEKAVAAPGSSSAASLAELEEVLGQALGRPALVRVRSDWSVSTFGAFFCRSNKPFEQRMGIKGLRFEFRMELHPYKPGVIYQF